MKIIKSPNPLKKYRALFNNGRHTDFGASGYDDYITSKSEVKKRAYLARHRVNENWQDAYSSGALARWILWNLPTLEASIADYNRRFSV
jgi:hypothetical protein